MGIFIKRPLCLFCFCFIFSALLACFIATPIKLCLLLALLVGAAVFFILSRRKAERKYGFIQTSLALFFAALALVWSVVFVDVREYKHGALEADGVGVEFVVLDEKYSSRYSSKYEGKIVAIDGTEVSVSAYLALEFESDFVAGDRLLLIGNVSKVDNNSQGLIELPSEVLLEVVPTIDKDLIISEEFREFDLSVICARLREYVKNIFVARLDKNSAALSLGVLTGDKAMIDTATVRDFRRTGISHLLAVSGLHLTVILGAIELILRALCVRKGKRCVIITFLSFFLLLLSGFSPSACRAVLMLLVAYLCYALSRESDTLTSLSVAAALMLFVSPLSVGSLSFWLSFLATLGIILYAEVMRGRRLIKASGKGRLLNLLSPFVKKVLGAIIVTLSANVFICIVFWLFFGEVSVISPISNLLISPLAEVYLILTVIVFVFGAVPFLSTIFSYAAGVLSSVIIKLAAFFSSLDFSVVSLKYPFAGIIISAATVLLAVLFIVKLKKRLRILTVFVPISAVLAFVTCLGVYNLLNTSVKVAYVNTNESDALVVADEGRCAIVDVSDGRYSSLYNPYRWASDNTLTEIESVVLTHYHARHISSLDRIFREAMVRSVCLPAPDSEDELEIMKDIISSAVDNGVSVQIYDKEKIFTICDEFDMFVLDAGTRDGSSKKIISFVLGTADGVISYADRSWHQADNAGSIAHFVSSSDAAVLGLHGPAPSEEGGLPEADYPLVVVGADASAFVSAPALSTAKSKLLIAKETAGARICEFEFVHE